MADNDTSATDTPKTPRIPRPPSREELEEISEAQSMITDDWTGEGGKPDTKDHPEQDRPETMIRSGNGGRQLAAIDEGPEDGPLVILLHGFPEFSYAWRNQVGPLADDGWRVLVPDQIGYNLSDKPADLDSYDIDALADDVLRLAEVRRPSDFLAGRSRLGRHRRVVAGAPRSRPYRAAGDPQRAAPQHHEPLCDCPSNADAAELVLPVLPDPRSAGSPAARRRLPHGPANADRHQPGRMLSAGTIWTITGMHGHVPAP